MKDLEFKKDFEDLLDIVANVPERFNYLLDLQIHDCSRNEKWAEFSFQSKECWLNNHNGVHGGIICSILDTCMGYTCGAYSGRHVSTTDISVSYLKPMQGQNYIVRVDLTQVGNRMARCTGYVKDRESGVVCATAMSSFIVTANMEKGARV